MVDTPEVATKAPESDAAESGSPQNTTSIQGQTSTTEPAISSNAPVQTGNTASLIPGDTPAQTGASLGEHCTSDRPTRM